MAGLDRLAGLLAEDLRTMARPLEGDEGSDARGAHWCAWLAELAPDTLSAAQLHALTSGKRGKDDSLHLLVMDLHKALNRLAAELSSETIDGAHVWQVGALERPRNGAFLRGLDATRAL